MLQRLDHPVILRGFDAVLDGPRPHLVLEHLEGPRLSTLVRKLGPLSPQQYLAMDKLADSVGNATLRITTRQGLQYHFVRKGDMNVALQMIRSPFCVR